MPTIKKNDPVDLKPYLVYTSDPDAESGGGSSVTIESLTATENKTYTAPEGKAYSPVTVDVPSTPAEHSIYCVNGDFEALSPQFHAAKFENNAWAADGDGIASAAAGSMLITSAEVNMVAYYYDPMVQYPEPVPFMTSGMSDNIVCMPDHDIIALITNAEPD